MVADLIEVDLDPHPNFRKKPVSRFGLRAKTKPGSGSDPRKTPGTTGSGSTTLSLRPYKRTGAKGGDFSNSKGKPQ